MREAFLLYLIEGSVEKRLLGVFTDKKKAMLAADKHTLETEGEEMNRNEFNSLMLSGKNETFEIENYPLNTYLK